MSLLHENDVKAELSYAYLHAVASHAGFGCISTDRHTDSAGVDAVVRVKERLAPNSIRTEFTLEIQLKATATRLTQQQGRFSFPMKTPHYDKLRKTDIAAPRFLAVLMMPADKENWLQLTAEELRLRECVRWVSLRNAPEIDQDSITVYVPADNILTPDALRTIAMQTSREEWIDYGA